MEPLRGGRLAGGLPPAAHARRRHLPSRAATSPARQGRNFSRKAARHLLSAVGARTDSTLRKVSWLGIPPGSSSPFPLSHAVLARPKSAIS